MKIILFITVVLCTTVFAMEKSCAGVVASMPNQAGGKIVLTDEACIHNGRNYSPLLKSYFYTPSGLTGDGCWRLDDETVVIVWIDSNTTRRYPAVNFDIRRR